ncbi:uncharacterized protein RBU57_005826 isoform 1-T2 [Macrochelys suwanniensis]
MNRVGPLSRATWSGKKCILVVMDFATRYPEVVALSSTGADTGADALLTIFSRMGVPSEVFTDQGSEVISARLRGVWEKGGIWPTWASAYHPQSNGLVERVQGTVRPMLRTCINQHPQDWDKYLPHRWHREVPQESPGGFPFKLWYGRRVRGPLEPVRDDWEEKGEDPLMDLSPEMGAHPPSRCPPFRVTGKRAQNLEREAKDRLALEVNQSFNSPGLAKVEAIRDWPVPQTKEQVQAFSGMAVYYQRFVPPFSSLAAPITELGKKRKPDEAVWTEQGQRALCALKEALIQGPINRVNPDRAKPCTVFTEASDTGLGVVLMQAYAKRGRHPIGYLSKEPLPWRQNGQAIERECLAMGQALKKQQPNLFGWRFTVYSHHLAPMWLHPGKGADAERLVTETRGQRGDQIKREALNQESPNYSPPDWSAGKRPDLSLNPRGFGMEKGHGPHKPSHMRPVGAIKPSRPKGARGTGTAWCDRVRTSPGHWLK